MNYAVHLSKEELDLISVEHRLKTWSEYFEAVNKGVKTFEIRNNDRGFQVGEKILLEEWDLVQESYTGRVILAMISYITDFAQLPGYVVMGLKLL